MQAKACGPQRAEAMLGPCRNPARSRSPSAASAAKRGLRYGAAGMRRKMAAFQSCRLRPAVRQRCGEGVRVQEDASPSLAVPDEAAGDKLRSCRTRSAPWFTCAKTPDFAGGMRCRTVCRGIQLLGRTEVSNVEGLSLKAYATELQSRDQTVCVSVFSLNGSKMNSGSSAAESAIAKVLISVAFGSPRLNRPATDR